MAFFFERLKKGCAINCSSGSLYGGLSNHSSPLHYKKCFGCIFFRFIVDVNQSATSNVKPHLNEKTTRASINLHTVSGICVQVFIELCFSQGAYVS